MAQSTISKTRVAAASLMASTAIVTAIGINEGFRSQAYQDVVGVWTIGYGETKGVKKGDTITKERAQVQLKQSVDAHAKGMINCIKVPLYQHEYDAYASFTYNVGVGNFCRSDVARELNKGNYEQACKNLLHWDYAGGKKYAGLTRRRQEESKLCLGQ
jgi:lysozyme